MALSRVRLCDPMDCRASGSSVHGILQARILEWVAMPSSRGSSQPRDRTQVSSIAGSSVQSLCCVRIFAAPWTRGMPGLPVNHQLPGIIQTQVHWVVMISNHLILCHPLLPPSVFPRIRIFSNESVVASGGQSIGVSASAPVLPMNIQDWFPLSLTDWISLLFRGLSRVFSNTTVQKHQFFSARLSL